jgi:hypothetical protein
MTVMLKDAPGGAELIGSLTNAIETLALLYSGTSDDAAREHLQTYITRIEPGIVEAVGSDTAAKMLDIFRRAVIGEKHAIERGIASRQ